MHDLRKKKARLRRQKNFRRFSCVARIVRFWDIDDNDPKMDIHFRDFVGRLMSIRGICSEACCGNPRKFFKELTRQEHLADLNQQEMEKEFWFFWLNSDKGKRHS